VNGTAKSGTAIWAATAVTAAISAVRVIFRSCNSSSYPSGHMGGRVPARPISY